MNIIECIPTGKNNAITRSQLCAVTGYGDRVVRKAIEQARHDGAIIINDQDGLGYYQTDDISIIERQYHQNESRAKSILHYQKALRTALKEAGRL